MIGYRGLQNIISSSVYHLFIGGSTMFYGVHMKQNW